MLYCELPVIKISITRHGKNSTAALYDKWKKKGQHLQSDIIVESRRNPTSGYWQQINIVLPWYRRAVSTSFTKMRVCLQLEWKTRHFSPYSIWLKQFKTCRFVTVFVKLWLRCRLSDSRQEISQRGATKAKIMRRQYRKVERRNPNQNSNWRTWHVKGFERRLIQ